jgi:hypothetical protein
MLEHTFGADWSPDGDELAVSRWVEGKCRLEYPVGHLLYETDQRIPVVRVSPGGDLVAFLEEVSVAGSLFNTSRLSVVDRAGKKEALFDGWGATGITWSSGREIWIDTWGETLGTKRIHAVALSGKGRLVTTFGGADVNVADVSSDGRALIVEFHGRDVILALAAGEDRERNLSWHSDSSVVDLSRDGRAILFNEIRSGGGRSFGTSLRRTARRLSVSATGTALRFPRTAGGRWRSPVPGPRSSSSSCRRGPVSRSASPRGSLAGSTAHPGSPMAAASSSLAARARAHASTGRTSTAGRPGP